MKRHAKTSLFAALTSTAVALFSLAPSAAAQPTLEQSSYSGSSNTDKNLKGKKSSQEIENYNAENLAPAPGDEGAFVDLIVQGYGLHVHQVAVKYQPGLTLKAACGVKIEISYTEADGRQRTEAQNPPCSIGLAWAEFPFNRDFKDGTFVCGRVQVDGKWSNNACIKIHA